MAVKRRIYTLNGYPPEVIAVAFAKTSRSPEPFDKNASELNEDKSRQFHEKWVINYGHSSIAEHAVLSLAMENVSILFTKVIEDNRLASYTEKSTRYQIFDKEHYYKPENIMNSELVKEYQESCDFSIDTYTELFNKMTEYMKTRFIKTEEESEALYNIKIKNKVLDNIRYMLPVSCLTNLGMTINARNLSRAITKLLSHPLKEMQEIGQELKECASNITPTLLKHAEKSEFIEKNDIRLAEMSKTLEGEKKESQNDIELVHYDPQAEDKFIATILYKNTNLPFKEIMEKVKKLSMQEKQKIIDSAFENLDKYDTPIRETEIPEYVFDVLIDYGAFRDVQRHRICTQINPDLTPDYGYSVPQDITEAGFELHYRECMEKANLAFKKIKEKFPKEAQYVLPLAYRKRLLLKMNLREVFHFIRLRSGKTGHISYRRIAQKMHTLVNEVHPMFGKNLVVDKS
jgi:thymidylate synthase ThyX